MEFKRLSDVEVVAEPTESANVLIEENGVIKKAPKTAVGGAGSASGGEADLVIALTMRLDNNNPISEDTSVSIESGSLEAVVEALRDGRPPVVKCKRYCLVSGFNTSYAVAEGGVYDCNVYYYGGTIYFSFLASHSVVRIAMDIDDPDYLEVWYHPLSMTNIQVI